MFKAYQIESPQSVAGSSTFEFDDWANEEWLLFEQSLNVLQLLQWTPLWYPQLHQVEIPKLQAHRIRWLWFLIVSLGQQIQSRLVSQK